MGERDSCSIIALQIARSFSKSQIVSLQYTLCRYLTPAWPVTVYVPMQRRGQQNTDIENLTA